MKRNDFVTISSDYNQYRQIDGQRAQITRSLTSSKRIQTMYTHLIWVGDAFNAIGLHAVRWCQDPNN